MTADPDRRPSGRITLIEAAAGTAVLGLLAALAAGVFDPMLGR